MGGDGALRHYKISDGQEYPNAYGEGNMEATGASGLRQMPPAAFSVRGNKMFYVWQFVKN